MSTTRLSFKALSSGSNAVVGSFPQFETVERLLFFCVSSSEVAEIAVVTVGTVGEAMSLDVSLNELDARFAVEGFSFSSSLAVDEVRFLAREFWLVDCRSPATRLPAFQ